MAAGDLKGEEVIVRVLKAGTSKTITKGQAVRYDSGSTGWQPAVADDIGKFAVAIDGAANGGEFRAVIYGRVDVTASGAIAAYGLVSPDAGGKVKAAPAKFTGDDVTATVPADEEIGIAAGTVIGVVDESGTIKVAADQKVKTVETTGIAVDIDGLVDPRNMIGTAMGATTTDGDIVTVWVGLVA